jgi:MOSC domain-containing protein YiiM
MIANAGGRILSVNVGLPREVPWRGRTVRTSIFKSPVAGPVLVRKLNLDGDRQSDLQVHGGTDMAVYAYPGEHYAFWRTVLPGAELPWGAFGENLTTEGLLEDEVCIGDRIRCGPVEFVVTQPRLPCYKLGIRFGRQDIVKRFQRSGRTGFYLAVLGEGKIAAGCTLERIASGEASVRVTDVVRLYNSREPDRALLRRASELPALPEAWREHFRARLTAGAE